jgi:hypothetical protein
LEVVANRLAVSAKIRWEECLHNGGEGTAVLTSAQGVAFVRIVNISHRDAVHRGDDLLGLRSFTRTSFAPWQIRRFSPQPDAAT